MELSILPFLLLLPSLHPSTASLLPPNSTHLHLPSQNTILLTSNPAPLLRHSPWPPVPYSRPIKNDLHITITAYGDTFPDSHTPDVLRALPPIQRTILDAGEPDDILDEITTVGTDRDGVYVDVGFYALHPPAGITRAQAADVVHKVWQLCIEFFPVREITASEVALRGVDVALFRLSFRQT